MKSFSSVRGSFIEVDGTSVVTGLEQDRWFVLYDNTDTTKVCLYNIAARVFLSYASDTIGVSNVCEADNTIFTHASVAVRDIDEGNYHIQSSNGRYVLDSPEQDINALGIFAIKDAE